MFQQSRSIPRSKSAKVSAREVAFDALAFLAEHELAPNPGNYELAYCYKSNSRSFLARSIDAVIMTGECLSQSKADELLALHHQKSGSEAEDEQSRIRDQTRKLADLATMTKAATGQFGRDLASGLDEMGEAGTNLSAIVTTMIDRGQSAEQALAEAGRQIEKLRQEVEAAKGDASRDALTGLHNRRGVETEVLGLRDRQLSAVALCDVDHFKRINDRFGHAIGDRVLKAVAKSLADSCRPHRVARWGGEEFIILMIDTDVASAAEVVDRARRQLNSRTIKVSESGEPLGTITFSAGIAQLDGRAFESAVNTADVLLYEAKSGGRDQVLSEAAK